MRPKWRPWVRRSQCGLALLVSAALFAPAGGCGGSDGQGQSTAEPAGPPIWETMAVTSGAAVLWGPRHKSIRQLVAGFDAVVLAQPTGKVADSTIDRDEPIHEQVATTTVEVEVLEVIAGEIEAETIELAWPIGLAETRKEGFATRAVERLRRAEKPQAILFLSDLPAEQRMLGNPRAELTARYDAGHPQAVIAERSGRAYLPKVMPAPGTGNRHDPIRKELKGLTFEQAIDEVRRQAEWRARNPASAARVYAELKAGQFGRRAANRLARRSYEFQAG